MSKLNQIHTVAERKPRMTMVFGPHGVGKSTMVSQTEGSVVIQSEDGLRELEGPRFPVSDTFGDVMECAREMYEGDHDFKTLGVDTIDHIEPLIWKKVCEDHGRKSIEDFGYGKGYVYAIDYWRQFLNAMLKIREKRNMAILLIAHSKVETSTDPELDPYDRYVPRLHKHACSLVCETVDAVFFLRYKVFTRKTGEGFRQITKGVGDGQRILLTQERPGHIAKCRVNLPYELPSDWPKFNNFLQGESL